MEMTEDHLRLILDNNVRMEALTRRIDEFITEARCCNDKHERALQCLELQGSKAAQDALREIQLLDGRITPLEKFKETHEGRAAGIAQCRSLWDSKIARAGGYAAIAIGILGLGLELLRFALDLFRGA